MIELELCYSLYGSIIHLLMEYGGLPPAVLFQKRTLKAQKFYATHSPNWSQTWSEIQTQRALLPETTPNSTLPETTPNSPNSPYHRLSQYWLENFMSNKNIVIDVRTGTNAPCSMVIDFVEERLDPVDKNCSQLFRLWLLCANASDCKFFLPHKISSLKINI